MAISKIGTTSKIYKDYFEVERSTSLEPDADGNLEVVYAGEDSPNDMLLKLIDKINELVDKVNALGG